MPIYLNNALYGNIIFHFNYSLIKYYSLITSSLILL